MPETMDCRSALTWRLLALLAFCMAALCLSLPLAAETPPDDHPLVTRFADAELVRWEFSEGTYTLPLGALRTRRDAEPDLARSRIIEGHIQRRMYRISRRSPVAVYSHYARTLQAQGFNSLFIARGSTLDTTQGSAWIRHVYQGLYGQESLPLDLIEAQDASARQVLVSRLPRSTGDVHVVLLVNPRTRNEVYVQLDVIESRPSRPGLSRSDWRALQQQLARDGRAVVDGIRFSPGSADVGGDIEQALTAIIELIQQDRQARYALVVHDNAVSSPLAEQIALSQQRADALLQRLQAMDSAAAEAVQARGLGPLSPVADPASTTGRAANSRVELVRY